MTGPNLTPVERAVYEAARAEAHAQRWRIEADLRERDGDDASHLRQYQRDYEAEAGDRWQRLAELKGEEHAQAVE